MCPIYHTTRNFPSWFRSCGSEWDLTSKKHRVRLITSSSTPSCLLFRLSFAVKLKIWILLSFFIKIFFCSFIPDIHTSNLSHWQCFALTYVTFTPPPLLHEYPTDFLRDYFSLESPPPSPVQGSETSDRLQHSRNEVHTRQHLCASPLPARVFVAIVLHSSSAAMPLFRPQCWHNR